MLDGTIKDGYGGILGWFWVACAVTTIGLVTVTALIGQGGLGRLILDGLTSDFRTPLVVGAVLSVALAVVADVALAGLQRLVTPWSRAAAR